MREGASLGERWTCVPGFEEAYMVSSHGRVRSNRLGATDLVGDVDRYGYRRILLSMHGDKTRLKVHRVVCEAFHGPCPHGMECAHLDGNAANNHADNLAWVTRSENNLQKRLHGTAQVREAHPRAKLTEAQVAEIRASSLGHRPIARLMGVSNAHIRRIRNGERWRDE